MDSLTLRNLQALSEGLKQLRSKTNEQDRQIEALKQQVAMLKAELGEVKSRANAAFAMARGHGATKG